MRLNKNLDVYCVDENIHFLLIWRGQMKVTIFCAGFYTDWTQPRQVLVHTSDSSTSGLPTRGPNRSWRKSLAFLFHSFTLPLCPQVAPGMYFCKAHMLSPERPCLFVPPYWINTFLTSCSLPQLHLCICSHLCMCIHVYTCVHVWVPAHTKQEYVETKSVRYHPALLSNHLVQVRCVNTCMYLLAYVYYHMGRNTCMCVHMCTHRILMSRWAVFFNRSPHYLLRQSHWQSLDIDEPS